MTSQSEEAMELNEACLLEMKGIIKRFPGIVANDDVSFSLKEGEIHALLGENGAGKSTLMSILAGLYLPDEGQILLDGAPVFFQSPRDALKKGIGMIYQHFMLVEAHTVAENIILGEEKSCILNKSSIEEEIRCLSDDYQLSVKADAKIWQLSVGEQQRVEILKALYRKARILIMDEPTAVLTPMEIRELFRTLRLLTEAGNAIVFISHKLDEVMEIANRVTVMKSGRVAGTVATSETSAEHLAHMMVGRDITLSRKTGEEPGTQAAISVQSLCVKGEKGVPALSEVSFEIRKGEILGLAGVAGNGQKELAAAMNGLVKIQSGTISLLGQDVTDRNPRELYENGIAFIPEDRLGTGLVPNLDVEDNMILRGYWRAPFSKGPFLQKNAIADFSSRLIEEYSIKVPSRSSPVKSLSGGNLQKILFSRELASEPMVLVAVHPTRGLDIGAVEFVRQKLLSEKKRGAAVFLISEDLEELLDLSDRVAVIFKGRFMGIRDARTATIDEIGLLMSGVCSGRGEPCV